MVERDKRYVWRELNSIAFCQKAVILCVAANFFGGLVYIFVSNLLVAAKVVLPAEAFAVFAGPLLIVGLIFIVFVFHLATKVYGVGLGVLLGLLTLVPFLGLIVLLVINGKATAVLKGYGIRAGFFGADMSAFAGQKRRPESGGGEKEVYGGGQPQEFPAKVVSLSGPHPRSITRGGQPVRRTRKL